MFSVRQDMKDVCWRNGYSGTSQIEAHVIIDELPDAGGLFESPAQLDLTTTEEERMGLLDVFRKGGAEKAKRPQPRQFSLVIAGYGVEAKPKLPAGVAHLEDSTLIFGPMNAAPAKAQAAQGGLKNVLLKPGKAPRGVLEKRPIPGSPIVTYSTGQEGTTQLALGNGMDSYEAVLEGFRATDGPAQWTIVTDDHEIRWPAKLTLRADGDLNPGSWPYEFGLDGSAENLLYLQGPLTGPEQIPPPARLIAPGMEMVGQGDVKGTVNAVIWIELAYEHGGAKWKKRFYYIPIDSESVYLLRAQVTEAVSAKMFEAADLIATSFRPRR